MEFILQTSLLYKEAHDTTNHAIGKESTSLLLQDIDVCLKDIYCYMLRISRSCFPAAPFTVIS